MVSDKVRNDLCGVAFTLATPFTEDSLDVDNSALRRNLGVISEAGARTVIPCGNTGEYHSLTNSERISIVKTVVEEIGDSATVLAGAGGSTGNVLKLTRGYEEAGADALLIMYPRHTFKHEAGVLEYYREIIEATELGVVVYKRGDALTAAQIDKLAAYDTFLGVKYALNDVPSFSKAVKKTSDDVIWINGLAELFAPAFSFEGADGFTTGVGNFIPEETIQLMDTLRNDDWDGARELRDLFRPLEDLRAESGKNNSLGSANNVPAVKYGMDLCGLYGGPVRPPLVNLSDEDKRRVQQYLGQVQD